MYNKKVLGIILDSIPLFETDKRLVILTKELGKIVVIAKGARNIKSKYMAKTDVFVFGEFEIIETSKMNKLVSINVQNYYREITKNFDVMVMCTYFCQIISKVLPENQPEVDVMRLLYFSIDSLVKDENLLKIIKPIFLIKLIQFLGFMPLIQYNKEYLKYDYDGENIVYNKFGFITKELLEKIVFIFKTNIVNIFKLNFTEQEVECLEKLSKLILRNNISFAVSELDKKIFEVYYVK